MGSCPSPVQLADALERTSLTVAAGDAHRWRLAVVSSRRDALVQIYDPKGRLATSRTVTGSDCLARARAAAIIAVAQFLPMQLPRTLASARPTSPKPSGPSPWRLSIGLAGGLTVWPGPEAAAVAQADIGLRFKGLGLRLVAITGTPMSQQSIASDRLRLRRTAWRLEAGGLWSDQRWLLGGFAGAGVELLQVTALDLDRGERLRTRPALSASAVLGFRLVGRIYLRGELTARLRPRADRYLVGGTEVGHSSWGGVAAGLGLQGDFSVGAFTVGE